MDRLLLKATVTTTDEGTFSAVISTAAADRENDVVIPSAMVDALQAWNRPVALDWNHSSDPEDIVGHITPAAVKAVGDEVVADGEVDLETERGRHVWRLMKKRSIGFSFAYMIIDAVKRIDGVREIRQLDVFAVTACKTPMNNGTRVLSTKALDDRADIREKARREMFELLCATPEPVATKSLPLPVQIASYEA
jgi:HK97 family phage prohead protease